MGSGRIGDCSRGVINNLNCLSDCERWLDGKGPFTMDVVEMLFPANEMTTNVLNEGIEQKQESWLVREGWSNGGRQ